MHEFLIYTPVCTGLKGCSGATSLNVLEYVNAKVHSKMKFRKMWGELIMRLGEASVTKGHGKDRTFYSLQALMDDKAGDQY